MEGAQDFFGFRGRDVKSSTKFNYQIRPTESRNADLSAGFLENDLVSNASAVTIAREDYADPIFEREPGIPKSSF